MDSTKYEGHKRVHCQRENRLKAGISFTEDPIPVNDATKTAETQNGKEKKISLMTYAVLTT